MKNKYWAKADAEWDLARRDDSYMIDGSVLVYVTRTSRRRVFDVLHSVLVGVSQWRSFFRKLFSVGGLRSLLDSAVYTVELEYDGAVHTVVTNSYIRPPVSGGLRDRYCGKLPLGWVYVCRYSLLSSLDGSVKSPRVKTFADCLSFVFAGTFRRFRTVLRSLFEPDRGRFACDDFC